MCLKGAAGDGRAPTEELPCGVEALERCNSDINLTDPQIY